ncbi:uncharacterized protein VTP21DRAFT_6924 [Calcarisporiella thermophila]|uniref:uncharacterized protein n=1 Tax=Calcarisporiella thermophila TaxID=911321 RepID=UPI003743F8A9
MRGLYRTTKTNKLPKILIKRKCSQGGMAQPKSRMIYVKIGIQCQLARERVFSVGEGERSRAEFKPPSLGSGIDTPMGGLRWRKAQKEPINSTLPAAQPEVFCEGARAHGLSRSG